MNLETLENKTILLFGQARAFSQEEFDAQLKVHSITLVKEFQEDIALIIKEIQKRVYNHKRILVLPWNRAYIMTQKNHILPFFPL